MTRPTKLIIDCSTNETVEVELTDEEIALADEQRVAWEAQEATRLEAEEAKNALKASARAKLVAGEALTEEEAALLVL
jgi:hypothetical protein